MGIQKLAEDILLAPFRKEAETAKHGSCDCCDKRPWKYRGVVTGIETYYCWECAGETEEEQDE